MPRVGTVSWLKEDWEGPFYPDGLPRDQWLEHYAGVFDTVEVDSTFYRMPSRDMCAAWRRRTPGGFRFAVKVPGRVTHQKVLKDCDREMDRFHQAVRELGDKLSFVVLQFQQFGPKSACPNLESFMARLASFAALCEPDNRYVVEVRNPDWLRPELFDFLHERRFILALAEVDDMPNPRQLWDRFGVTLLTGDAVYMRIFGERKKMEARTKRFGRLLIDRTRETTDWVRVVRAIELRGAPVWMYFSNYFAGYAPGSAQLFQDLWKDSRGRVAKRRHPKAS
jgi:uncharacterized protein YecE (DUF72 family)